MAEDTVDLVKCLVWDLDETLWRGTLLEDDDLALAPGVPDVIRTLDARGMLQSVASRNDHDHAWPRLERLGVAEYLVLPRIGWGRKSDAVRAIADRAGLRRAGAIAFVDDQPVDRAEVAYHLPEVRCYAADEAPTLPARPELSPAVVTVDAQAAAARCTRPASAGEAARAGLRRPGRRLPALARAEDADRPGRRGGAVPGRGADPAHQPDERDRRALLGRPTCAALLADPRHEVLVMTMTDRFGPHGAVGVALLATRRHPPAWHLKLLATSCRVVSFGAGSVLLRWLTDQAAAAGAHLVADFRPTDRNRMMEVAYRFAGFTDEPAATCRPRSRPDTCGDAAAAAWRQRVHADADDHRPCPRRPPGRIGRVG